MKEFDIDVVIVTQHRYSKLTRCAANIITNRLKPKNLIIIDSSSDFNRHAKNKISILSRKYKVGLKYIRVPHKGVGYSRNVGLSNVKSSYFAYIDDDEYVPKFWLEKVAKIFNVNKNIDALGGPKIPSDIGNYWHRVWIALIEKEFNYIGIIDTLPSGNSIYSTSFIKKHNLRFDQRFKQCSEDQAFSYELRRNKANIFFHKSIWVKHDVRRSIIPFIRQWFYYGVNKHLYHRLYLGSGDIFELSKVSLTLRNFIKTFPYRINMDEISVLPGAILLNITFVIGFLYSFFGSDTSS